MTEKVQKRALPLDDQLCFALYAATNAITRAYRPRLEAQGLTYPQYLVMLALWQHGSMTPGDIARRLRLGANAMPPILRHLEASGLVVRAPDPTDKRRVIVALTEDGRRIENAASEAQEMVVCDTGLDPEALEELRAQLQALASRLTAAG